MIFGYAVQRMDLEVWELILLMLCEEWFHNEFIYTVVLSGFMVPGRTHVG